MSEQPYSLLMDEHGNVIYKDVCYEKYKKLQDENDALRKQLEMAKDGIKTIQNINITNSDLFVYCKNLLIEIEQIKKEGK